MENELNLRFAKESETDTILYFIKRLAEYEKMSDEVVATPASLREWIFEKKKAEVILASVDGRDIGFAVFFYNFSTFVGRGGIYLEDLFILPEFRGHGYGKALLEHVREIAVERGCGRVEWCCLDWNQSGIDFYLSMGAVPMNGWTTYRFVL